MKAVLTITLTKPDGGLDSELKLWHSWDELTVDPEYGVISVRGKTFNQTYPIDGLIKIKVANTSDEAKTQPPTADAAPLGWYWVRDKATKELSVAHKVNWPAYPWELLNQGQACTTEDFDRWYDIVQSLPELKEG